MSLLRLQDVNIKAYNSMPIREPSRKLWNQECFTLTFPKPPQPGRKKRSRPSELKTTVPRHEKRKLEEDHKPAHIWIRPFLRNFNVRRQAPFGHPCTLKTHPEKAESKNLEDDAKEISFMKDSKKNTRPQETNLESKEIGNDKKTKRGDKTDKTPSKSSYKSELSKKSKYKSGTNSKSKDSQTVLMKHLKKGRAFKNYKETDIESICTKKDSKSSKNNVNAKSEACSKNSSNMDLMIYLEESVAESMEFDMWLKNYSQNNSKKSSKKETKKSSDAESSDSKDIRKDKRSSRKSIKKKNAKDTESTDVESDSESEPKKGKKDSKKGKKGSKKDDKKKDIKKDILSTDDDPESEWISKKGEKDEKLNKSGSKKGDKKKSAVKSEESSETESDWESKKDKRDSKRVKRNSKKDARKNIDSTDAESDEYSKKGTKKPVMSKGSDAESEESIYKSGAKKKGVDESDATSTDSKKEALGMKRDLKMSFRKTTFKGKEQKTGRVPPSRESSLPSPCEPLQLSPKIKRLCRCKMVPPRPKPRYAPLPEAKWIHKLL